MIKIWVISDTHFGHQNLVRKFKRSDGSPLRDFDDVRTHDETLIENWNARVRPQDHVYHLGDFAMARSQLATAGRLNGHKILVRGNHDTFRTRDYLDAGFEEILGVRIFRPQEQQGGFILSHVPLHPGSLPPWARNVHGHTHANVVCDAQGQADDRYVCVSVEHTGYAPVLLSTL